MEKRYQVFVSSTYRDLELERQEVIQALLELDCFPAGMELFPAADEDQWSLIQKVIDDSDYYLVIIGGRYGSLGPAGLSYTEMEYRYALDQQKPTIGFLHKDPGKLPSERCESDPKLQEKLKSFRELVQSKVVKHWTSPSELGSVVSRSVVKLIKNTEAIGWVRGDNMSTEVANAEIIKLRQRIDELKSELEQNKTQRPSGTEDLAQGEDTIALNVSYSVGPNDHDFQNPEDSGQISVSWNDLFRSLSPEMINECAAPRLHRALQNALIPFVRSQLHTDLNNRIGNLKLSNDDFQTVVIQLKALGLIIKSDKQKSVKDSSTYWTLTPYGETVMTRLRAIKK